MRPGLYNRCRKVERGIYIFVRNQRCTRAILLNRNLDRHQKPTANHSRGSPKQSRCGMHLVFKVTLQYSDAHGGYATLKDTDYLARADCAPESQDLI